MDIQELKERLLTIAEQEPELMAALVDFLSEQEFYGHLKINRGGRDVQYEILKSTKRKKLCVMDAVNNVRVREL